MSPTSDPAAPSLLAAELERVKLERDAAVAAERVAREAGEVARRRLDALEYVTASAPQHVDVEALLGEVLGRLREVLGADRAAVHLLAPAGEALVLRAASGVQAARIGERTALGAGVVGRVARDREPLLVPDLAAQPELASSLAPELRSALAVPLATRDRAVGVLEIAARAPASLREEDTRLAQAVAARLALAIENALLHAEAHYERTRWRAMVRAMLDPVALADAQGRVVYVNPAGELLIPYPLRPGLPSDEDAAYYELRRPDGTPFPSAELPLVRAAAAGEEVHQVEVVHRRQDGAEAVVVYSASPLRDAQGKLVGGVAVGRDVTEHRKVERDRERLLSEVRHRAAELEATLDAIADGLVINAPDREVVRMNDAARRMLGWTDAEVQVGHRERTERSRALDEQGEPLAHEALPLSRALRGEIVRGQVLCLERPGLDRLWVRCSAAPIRDDEGRLLGAVTTIADITRQRESDEQREDLLRGVSHDLRTPLTSMLIHAQRLERHADPDVRRRTHAIVSGGRRIDALIRDLVESARLEAGQLRLAPEPLDLRRFVEELLARTPALDAERVRVSAEGEAVALADPARIERVVLNLLSNALKYSRPGSAVSVRIARSGGEVTTSVSDEGEGIPEAELPRLFGRYWRSQRTTAVEGTGLGLYVSKLLVEAHGGRIEAASTEGVGSTFTFVLPAPGARGAT